MALQTPAVVVAAPPPTTNGDDGATGPAIVEQADTSEIVVKKPMPNLPTGVQ